jgi:hypothetical protein
MRNGLRNLSNTALMTAGAAHGAGIYASANYMTSFGYTARYNGNQNFWKNTIDNLRSTSNFIIGIVEIINKKNYEKSGDRNIVVVTDEDDIIIRYLLVIKSGAA